MYRMRRMSKDDAGKDACARRCAPKFWSGGLMVGRRSYKPDVEGSIPAPTTLECGGESSRPRFHVRAQTKE
jgi:hypothetical protein